MHKYIKNYLCVLLTNSARQKKTDEKYIRVRILQQA